MASSQSVLIATSNKCPTSAQSRPLAKFHPNIWADRFVSFVPSSLANSPYESYQKQIQDMKEKVREMLLEACKGDDLVKKVVFIDTLCRLGVSYHFEEEIEQELKRSFHAEPDLFMSHHYDLYTTSLLFRVFRQHGHRLSCDIFNKFKNDEYNESDVRGILSLYEASHLRVHGEAFLDEALVFTTEHLKSFAQDHASHALVPQVRHALEQPLHKGNPRLESRFFISFYQQDETRDEMLLKFVKLDFNLLQLLHQQELGLLQRWWKDLNFASKLSYARDRLVECYLWITGVYYESHYSRARYFLTKIISLTSVIDDTYDAYATFEEAKLFTDAIQRWEASAVENLPEYMQTLYNTLLNVYEEIEKEVTLEGRSYSVNYAREAMKESVQTYYTEAEWLSRGYFPTYDEYLETSLISAGCHLLAVSSLVGMKNATIKDFQWIKAMPKCDVACQIIGRLSNDITGHKKERERAHIASSIECYMAKSGLSEEEAIAELVKTVDDAWKDMNEDLLGCTDVSMDILMRVVNLTRTMEVTYKLCDNYTTPTGEIKTYITLLFIEPLSMD